MNINDLEKTTIYKIYQTQKGFNSALPKSLRVVIYVLGFLSFLAIINNYWRIYYFSSNLISLSCFILVIALLILSLDIFINIGWQIVVDKKNSGVAATQNLFELCDLASCELFDVSAKLSKKYRLPTFQLASLVFGLYHTRFGRHFLARAEIIISADLEKEAMEKLAGHKVTKEVEEQNLAKLLEGAKEYSQTAKKNIISMAEIILSLYDNNQFFPHLTYELDLKKEDVANIAGWTDRLFNQIGRKYYWQKDYYGPGIGQEWASGYTPIMNYFSRDISQYLIDTRLEYQSLGHREAIKAIEDVLSKSGKNNVLLVGDPGVGKKTIVNGFAQIVAQGKTYNYLRYKHVIELDIGRILAGAEGRGELEARFSNILGEAVSAGNIILFINNIGSLVKGYAGEIGSIDATEFLIPYLESGRVQIIAAASWDDFKNRIQTNSNFEGQFTKIEVSEPKKNEMIPILEDALLYIEEKNRVLFTYQSIRQIVEVADRYIHDQPFPEKAIDLLGEMGIKAEKSQITIITPEQVNALVSDKIKIPVGKAEEEETKKLLHLEEYLHKRIIGQDEAISAIANALRRARAGIASNARPVGTFLFVGPTGVGKTETAKALAAAYYGSEKNMVRFDMSEFQEINTIGRLIGDKDSPGRLTQNVKNNPYTVVLLDELEKAHPNILNLLLQVLDEGRLTDAAGRAIDFTNTIIICTSNAGSEQIREKLAQNISGEELGKNIIEYLLSQGMFKPEFVNRFDKVVCFRPLTIQELSKVAGLMLAELAQTIAKKDIKLDITPEAIAKIVKIGYDPAFGARPMRRMIQERVENMLAKKMLSGEIKKGSVVTLTGKEI